jgi:hypothetical protein
MIGLDMKRKKKYMKVEIALQGGDPNEIKKSTGRNSIREKKDDMLTGLRQ